MTGWLSRLYRRVLNNSVNSASSSGFPCTTIHNVCTKWDVSFNDSIPTTGSFVLLRLCLCAQHNGPFLSADHSTSFFASDNEVMFLSLCVCHWLSAGLLKKQWTNFDFLGVGGVVIFVTSNTWVDSAVLVEVCALRVLLSIVFSFCCYRLLIAISSGSLWYQSNQYSVDCAIITGV